MVQTQDTAGHKRVDREFTPALPRERLPKLGV